MEQQIIHAEKDLADAIAFRKEFYRDLGRAISHELSQMPEYDTDKTFLEQLLKGYDMLENKITNRITI